MRVQRILLRDFFGYRKEEVEFPEAGLVCVVGPNGSGKSALGVEALAWALWGKTVRDADPTPDGDVEVEFRGDASGVGEDTLVRRVRSGRRLVDLRMRETAEGGPEDGGLEGCRDISGQTPAETQAKVDREFGDWRRFAATRVFSRSLLSRFSNATNKERQTLLESVLGLEQFTRAEKECRSVLVMRRAKSVVADGAVREAASSLERSRAALAGERGGRDVGVISQEVAVLAQRHAAQVTASQALRARAERVAAVLRKMEAEDSEKLSKIRMLSEQVKALQGKVKSGSDLKDCPVCLRPVGADERHEIVVHYSTELAPVKFTKEQLEAERAAAAGDLADMRQAEADVRAKLREPLEDVGTPLVKLQSELAAAKGQEETRARLQKMVTIDTKRVQDAELEAAKFKRDMQVAEAACEALGPRGARVRVFRDALGQLNAAAARVLSKLGMDITVRVTDKKVQASGKEVEEVSLEVTGAGGGSYSGSSDGERARIDVAILLALAEVAGAEGLLVFDEIFDPLDNEGVERAADLLEEMARDRQVLVITHNERFSTMVPAARTWRTERVRIAPGDLGTVSRVVVS